jgi:hypothetical protein
MYTALAEWSACMVYVLLLGKRFKGVNLAVYSAAGLAAQIIFQLIAQELHEISVYYWVPGMVGAAALMYLFLRVATKSDSHSVGAWTAQAFIFAEFLASIAWQSYYYIASTLSIFNNSISQILTLAVIFALGVSGLLALESRYMKHRPLSEPDQKTALVTAGIVIVFFALSNLSFVSSDTPFSGRSLQEIFYIRTLVDFSAIVLLMALREQKLWHHTQASLDAMETILKRQYEQYVISKESIDIINRKYHDMKHLITIIRAEKDAGKKDQYLNDMYDQIKMYETQNKTGNAILDTLLTSKSMVCAANGIQFTCVADGKLLDFMDVADICSIFGNALDNAIESAQAIADLDKRLVKVAVYQQNELLLIRFENYFEKSLNYVDGNLETTKRDKNFHGYGIKSIKSVADRHNGTVNVTAENNWFSLCILIPLPSQRN